MIILSQGAQSRFASCDAVLMSDSTVQYACPASPPSETKPKQSPSSIFEYNTNRTYNIYTIHTFYILLLILLHWYTHTLNTRSNPRKYPSPSGRHKRRDLPALINNPHRPLHDVPAINLQRHLRQSSSAPREVKSDSAPDARTSDGSGRPLLRQGWKECDSERHIETRHIWRLDQSIL